MLLLVPAAVLVLLLLASMAVDAAVAFLGERRAADLAAAVANDAASLLEEAAFYGADGDGGTVRLDAQRIHALLGARIAAHDDGALTVTGWRVERPAPDTLAVTIEGQVERLFGPALPGVGRTITVDATAVARLVSC